MTTFSKAIFFALAILFAIGANASTLDKTSCAEKALASDLDALIAPIQTRADLTQHLKLARALGSPLLNLEEKSRNQFVASLKFGENGINGYRYDILQRELTVSQIFQVLALIGQQQNLKFMLNARVESELDIDLVNQFSAETARTEKSCSGDHVGYECIRSGTCKNSAGYICTKNC